MKMLPLLSLALSALLGCASASAATLSVTVTGADGRPAADTVVLLQTAAPTPPPAAPTAPIVIGQKDIRFDPYVSVVPLGATVRFVNRDTFDHHVRSQPGGPLASVAPAKQFEFRLGRARGGQETSAEVQLDVAGAIVLGCHLHGSMRGHILVATTPWAAVTDDQGRVKIDGVPDGAIDLRVWHPDQFAEQPVQRLQVAGSAASEAKLNFTPRRRPPPRTPPKGEYEF